MIDPTEPETPLPAPGIPGLGGPGGDQAFGGAGPGGPGVGPGVLGRRDVHHQPGGRRAGPLGSVDPAFGVDPGGHHQRGERQRGDGSQQGLDNARATAAGASAILGCRPDQILVASTGVIGHQLPMPRVEAGLRSALDAADSRESSFHDASLAILTTDSRPKVVSLTRDVGGRTITLLGMAKGAAMIGPNMATMLGFLLTDARVSPEPSTGCSKPPSRTRSTASRSRGT